MFSITEHHLFHWGKRSNFPSPESCAAGCQVGYNINHNRLPKNYSSYNWSKKAFREFSAVLTIYLPGRRCCEIELLVLTFLHISCPFGYIYLSSFRLLWLSSSRLRDLRSFFSCMFPFVSGCLFLKS